MSQQQQSSRLAVFPTRQTLTVLKQKERGAVKGHVLLKRKSDALTARFRTILSRIHAFKMQVAEQFRTATFSIAELNFTLAGVGPEWAMQGVGDTAAFKVISRIDNVSGVALPVFEAVVDEAMARSLFELVGMAKGGQAVQKAREAHTVVLKGLLELASLQTAFLLLDDVIRATNRRVNALEYIVIPRYDLTIQYVAGELDEQDREEFFRLKKIQSKKKAPQQASEQCIDSQPRVEEDGIASLF